jgi:hypothetical protein
MASPVVDPPFFGVLVRRAKYACLANGGNYAYAYFRAHHQHEIAEDCLLRCVYCDCHENEAGGRESMELDHFRPWSRPGFEHLKDEPRNLHHACGRCNRLKSNKWPSTDAVASHDGTVGFIDPFHEPRHIYFEVAPDGELIALRLPATYLIRLLALNRPLLKLLRRRRIYEAELNRYEAANLARWEAAAAGQSDASAQEIAREFAEYRRLRQLSTLPMTKSARPPS